MTIKMFCYSVTGPLLLFISYFYSLKSPQNSVLLIKQVMLKETHKQFNVVLKIVLQCCCF